MTLKLNHYNNYVMKFLTITITIMLVHYLLTPFANASIQAHIEEHHSADKSHHYTHVHNNDLIHHHHSHEEESKDESQDQHEHNLVNIEKAYFYVNLKTIKNLNLIVLNQAPSLQFELKTSHLNALNNLYIHRAIPPPGSFRNLPLLS